MQHLLHGTLSVTIFEVNSLRNGSCGFDFFSKSGGTQNCGKRFFSKLKKMVLCRPEIVGSKLYATIDLDKARVGRTRMIENQPENPKWFESFRIYSAHTISDIVFTVKDDQVVGASLIGRAYLPTEEVVKGYIIDRWLEILDESRNPIGSKIHVKLHFVGVAQDTSWSSGIRGPNYSGVPYTFFNQRPGCRVTLYQDAHVPDNFIPKILLPHGKTYEAQRCWEDIFEAIANARHLVYVTGWSVYTEITLVRDPYRSKVDKGLKLGELLKKKADEGVAVLMLIWDDRTSVEEFKKDGLMATHDQETEQYFKNTNVRCVLCPRNPDDGRSIVQGFEISTMFTHHQKSVIVDFEMNDNASSSKRRIVSFIGGIDLCDGRYDTQDHPLFKTLDSVHYDNASVSKRQILSFIGAIDLFDRRYDTQDHPLYKTLDSVHYDDFHQPNFQGASIKKGGPREPWHDIHCRLEGPIAWDVLYNFEQRWLKQVGAKFLIPQSKLKELTVRPLPVLQTSDPEVWNVQLFRSIDGGAVSGFPEKPEDAAAVGLVSGKDNVIDRSIQDAYINAIRRAKNFIYIENQYFLGSSFGWRSKDIKVEEINALHLIPKELSLKIVSKINAKERFSVYVVIPMWPEGIPESGSVQAILDWQRRTMEMMYSDIVEALQRNGIQADPREYLSFFCLGNRETEKFPEYVPVETPEPDSDYARAQQSRRFMIYVHSKMMIVDDEYIIVGSANINQRSMDGGRDTEIAMGGFQPHYLAAEAGGAGNGPRGQIYGFRMALWYEHLGCLEPIFQHPESAQCMQRVNEIASDLWESYASEAFDQDLIGHLLKYPVQVNTNGQITTLPEFQCFPDTKAHVLGNKSDYLPPILTT